MRGATFLSGKIFCTGFIVILKILIADFDLFSQRTQRQCNVGSIYLFRLQEGTAIRIVIRLDITISNLNLVGYGTCRYRYYPKITSLVLYSQQPGYVLFGNHATLNNSCTNLIGNILFAE